MLSDSDSDVRLIEDSAVRRKGESTVRPAAALSDSDSDVRLAGDQPKSSVVKKKGSDSDVHLVSTGKTSKATPPESDSDVKLVTPRRPAETDRDIPQVAVPKIHKAESVLGDDDLVVDDDSGLTLKAGSGISLERLIDSGVSLESGDSGIALLGQADDSDLVTGGGSGILLSGSGDSHLSTDSSATLEDVPGSGTTLGADDSGIALELDEDSGIGLASPADSGIRLETPSDSGISLESHSGDELNQTIPMMAATGGSDVDQTNIEVPTFDTGSNYDLNMPGDATDDVADTSVILFDDETNVEDHAATRVRKKSDMEDSGETFDLEDAGEEVESLESDDLEVAEDVVGEDDELDDMDVFDAADEDFDESFSTGESHAEFVAPTRAAVAPVEAEWGAGTFAGLLVSTGVMALCGMVMFDLVRSMWGWSEPGAVTGSLISAVGGMFGAK